MLKESPLIIGAGPAGLTSAIYLSRAGLSPRLITGPQPGGQPLITTEIENYPGFEEGIQGPQLVQKMMKQAEKFGTQIIREEVISVNFEKKPFSVQTNKNHYTTPGIVITTGAVPRKLGLPSENKFFGRGISTCATCDGPFFREKTVAIVGGGDTAMQEANFLTTFCPKVYVIHRRANLTASEILQKRARENPKIEFIFHSEIKEIQGKDKVEKIKIIDNENQEERLLQVSGLFLAIGYLPNTQIFAGQLDINERGFIKTANITQTNIPGVFTAGDCADSTRQQLVAAAGDGCKASLDLQKFLENLD